MSLFSSIAHPGTAEASGISLRGLATLALALALGAALGMALNGGEVSDASEASAVVATELPHDEFIRLNTTDMDHLSPAIPVDVAEPQPTVDPFIYWNVTTLDNLVPAATNDSAESSKVSEEFLRWNIDSLEYSGPSYSEPPNGPR